MCTVRNSLVISPQVFFIEESLLVADDSKPLFVSLQGHCKFLDLLLLVFHLLFNSSITHRMFHSHSPYRWFTGREKMVWHWPEEGEQRTHWGNWSPRCCWAPGRQGGSEVGGRLHRCLTSCAAPTGLPAGLPDGQSRDEDHRHANLSVVKKKSNLCIITASADILIIWIVLNNRKRSAERESLSWQTTVLFWD